MIYEEYDPVLDEAIKLASPEFASSLKRRFTNVGISQSIRNNEKFSAAVKLQDVYIRDGQNRIQLKKIEIKEQLLPRMNEIVPSLKDRNLKISVDWYNIVLRGTYQMFNTSQMKLLPVVSTGEFIISIEDTIAQGLVGFTVHGEALQAINFDMNFTSENVSVQVEYYNNLKGTKESSSIKDSEIGNTIARHLQNDLFIKLEEYLGNNLNQVLMDYNLTEIFNENLDIQTKYRRMVGGSERATNIFVDKLTKELNKLNNISFNLPSISESGFIAQDGKFGNLQTLQRLSSFSKMSHDESGLVTIFGEIALNKCVVTYGYWNYWILHGFLKVEGNKRITKLKLTITPGNLLRSKLTFQNADFKVISLEGLEFDISGLGIFNWISDQIMMLLGNFLKTDISALLSKHMNKNLQLFVR